MLSGRQSAHTAWVWQELSLSNFLVSGTGLGNSSPTLIVPVQQEDHVQSYRHFTNRPRRLSAWVTHLREELELESTLCVSVMPGSQSLYQPAHWSLEAPWGQPV